MKKLIINLAPTGSVPTKKLSPHVPVEAKEIVDDVLRCAELGVSMVHLHARDRDGNPTYKKERYGEIIQGIRSKRPDLIIVVSTSGRIFTDFGQRSQVLNLSDGARPDMASLTLGSVNFGGGETNINNKDTVVRLVGKMREKGIRPELEIFDLGMVNFAHYLIKKDLIEPPYYFNIILGNLTGAQGKLPHLGLIVSELPHNSYWCLAGIGNCQKNMNATGILFGDGVRTGIEDNIWHDDLRTVLATNLGLVERVVKLTALMDRQAANPSEVRGMLGLSPVG